MIYLQTNLLHDAVASTAPRLDWLVWILTLRLTCICSCKAWIIVVSALQCLSKMHSATYVCLVGILNTGLHDVSFHDSQLLVALITRILKKQAPQTHPQAKEVARQSLGLSDSRCTTLLLGVCRKTTSASQTSVAYISLCMDTIPLMNLTSWIIILLKGNHSLY